MNDNLANKFKVTVSFLKEFDQGEPYEAIARRAVVENNCLIIEFPSSTTTPRETKGFPLRIISEFTIKEIMKDHGTETKK